MDRPGQQTARSFTNLPPEIQSSIICALYTSSKFPHYTAFLRTSKALYRAAHPIFLANYPLLCVPVKPRRKEHEGPPGDILKIVYPHDDERFGMHLYEEEWLDGLRRGLENLFEIEEEDDDDGERSDAEGSDIDDEDGEEQEQYLDEIDGSDINDMDASLSERGEQFARYWIHKYSFAKLLRKIGKHRVLNMERLEVNWGQWEANRMGELQQPGPYAVGITGLLCRLFLPNIQHILLKQTSYSEGEEEHVARDCRLRFGWEEGSEDEKWPEELRLTVMGPENDFEDDSATQSEMSKAVSMLVDACQGLKLLEMKWWGSRGHSKWWVERFQRTGLAIHVESVTNEPEV